MTAYREKALRVALALQALEAEAADAAGLGGGRAALSGAPGTALAAGETAAAGTAAAAGDAAAGAGPAAAHSRAEGARGVTPAALRKRSGVPGAAAILQKNYYAWFFRVERGRYTLTAAGQAALIEYAAVAEISAGKL